MADSTPVLEAPPVAGVLRAITKMAAKKQAKRWCFTLNNYTNDEWLNVVNRLTDKLVKYAVVGEETGDSGTIHLQGYVRFQKIKRMAEVKRHVGKRAHVEICRGSEEENAKIADAKLKEINTSYDNVTWKTWQQETINDIDGPIHDRKVMWIWDAKGGQGKSIPVWRQA